MKPNDRECSVFRTVARVGDAWSWLVLRDAVLYDARRFEDFRTRLGIARSTLSARLGQLVEVGMLANEDRHYEPSERGEDFFACLMAAQRWGERWLAGPELNVLHASCGRRTTPRLSCSSCGDPLLAREVSYQRRPAPLEPLPGPRPRQRAPGLDLLERGGPCSIARTLRVIGDYWSALVIQEAFYGVRRFDEFQRRLTIAPNILTSRLNRLLAHEVLERVAYQQAPLRHEYRITERGLDLYPVPLAMLTWGDRWLSSGSPPVPLTHRLCGQPFTALLTCDVCGEPLKRADVAINPSNARSFRDPRPCGAA